MPERLERLEVAPGSASEVQQLERRHRLDLLQQRGDVLAHVVIARAFPVGLRALVVMRKRNPAFMALVGKCMPKDINVGAQESLADLLRDAEECLAKRRSGSTANLVQDAGDHC